MNFRSTINSYIAYIFVGVYVFGVGLVLWYATYNSNPIANVMLKGMTAQARTE